MHFKHGVLQTWLAQTNYSLLRNDVVGENDPLTITLVNGAAAGSARRHSAIE